jgi:hypothetical protein
MPSEVIGRTIRVGWADGPRVRNGQCENRPRTSSVHPPKIGRSASSPRTVHSSRIIRSHRADGPNNYFQPKPTDQTDRNEAMHKLTKNMKNTRLSGSSRMVRRLGADGPPGAETVAQTWNREHELI